MADVHTFKIDPRYGVPDSRIKEFISTCEEKLGQVRVAMHDVESETAHLLVIVVTKVGVNGR